MVPVRGGTTVWWRAHARALPYRLMRRPQSAFGLAAVMASLLVASLSAAPVEAAREATGQAGAAAPAAVRVAASQCTPWTSETVPPASIRVLRTRRDLVDKDVVNTVQEVPFRDYVAVTMAVEWPEHYPLETIKAGAVVTKQFAWYYVIHPRGRTVKLEDGSKACYDVVDSTVDQYYYPEKYGIGKAAGPGPKIMAALDATWGISLRKFSPMLQSSRFFLTGYRAGSTSTCGADANGYKLFHHSARACGKDGLKFREILRRYLNPYLEIVTPGRHDIVGSRSGDAAAMARNDEGLEVAHVWAPVESASGSSSRAGVRIASDELVGYVSADVDTDGRDDLVWLVQTGPHAGRIRVATSDGEGYGADRTWYEGGTLVGLGSAELVVGDFNADGRPDVGILGRGDADGQAQLAVLKNRASGSFAEPGLWWSGELDLETVAAAWAGDMSGDGRADLIIRQHPRDGGVRLRTAITRSPLPSGTDRLSPLRLAWETSRQPDRVRTVAADATRDGREDVLVLLGNRGPATVLRLQGQSLGGLRATTLWRAPSADPVPVRRTRVGSADVDHDGMGDLVLFIEHPEGTRIRMLKARYTTLRPGTDIVSSLDWSALRPY